MKLIKKTYECGYCFGGVTCHTFDNFAEAFCTATKLGLDYLVCREENLCNGMEKKVFICWDSVRILSYNQMLDRMDDPEDQRIFQQRRNKKVKFLFNGSDDGPLHPRSYMSSVHFNYVMRIKGPKLSTLKKKFGC